jgi:hypothetical protein
MHTQIWTLAAYICGLSAQVMPISHLNCIARSLQAETTARRAEGNKEYNDTYNQHTSHLGATWWIQRRRITCIRQRAAALWNILLLLAHSSFHPLRKQCKILRALSLHYTAQKVVCSSHCSGSWVCNYFHHSLNSFQTFEMVINIVTVLLLNLTAADFWRVRSPQRFFLKGRIYRK